MKKVITIILIIILLGVFVFSAWQIVDILQEYQKGKQAYENLEQFVSIPEAAPEAPVQPQTPEKPQESEKPDEMQATEPQNTDATQWPEVDFDALLQINTDVVGWIYIPDTQVNYPIVRGADNDQYLYHLLTGEYNSSGSIFMDAMAMADFSMQNTPIYGHNMKNGTMFAGLLDYKKQEFYDTHPIAYLLTPEKNYVVHLFSGYVTPTRADVWDVAFTKEDFAAWLENAAKKSYFASDVTADVDDHIVTFSTCTYETNDARFVVHGVLEEYEKS